MLKQSECSKFAKAKFKQEAQGREDLRRVISEKDDEDKKYYPLWSLLSFEIPLLLLLAAGAVTAVDAAAMLLIADAAGV